MQKGHLKKMVRCGAHVQKLANICKNDVSILWQKKKNVRFVSQLFLFRFLEFVY